MTADPTTGAYKSETTWNESVEFGLAGGGGFSTIFAKPWYQYGVVPGKYRGEPDVASAPAFDGSVLIYFDPTPSSPGDDAGFYIVAGTSAGAPQWAALIALGAQLAHHSLGLVNDSIYVAARVRRVQGLSVPRHHDRQQRVHVHRRERQPRQDPGVQREARLGRRDRLGNAQGEPRGPLPGGHQPLIDVRTE